MKPVLACLLSLAACAGASPQGAETDVLLQPRSCWYGVYIDGYKVGFAHNEAGFAELDGRAVFRRSSRLLMRTLDAGVACESATWGEEDYDTGPPYLLLRMTSSSARNGAITTTTVQRVGAQFDVRQDDGSGPRDHRMPAGDFGLRDVMAEATWLRGEPAPGATLPVRNLLTDQLRIVETTTTLRGRGEAATPTGAQPCQLIERTGAADGTIEREQVGADGNALVWQLGSLELRREGRDVAMRGVVAVDLARLGSIPVDRPLGDPRRIRGLELRIAGAADGSFDTGGGQRVVAGHGVVTLTTDIAAAAAASPMEQQEHSRATLRLPCADPAVVALSRQAVGDTSDAAERVRRLCAFVSDYIVDDAVDCDHATVGEVMRKRTGDCSDHALLFATLARALSLPCRTVAGLVYGGDGPQAFLPHEWCEVVIDSRWLAVDPMWNEVPADGAHLRLSPTAAASPPAGGFSIEVLGLR